MIFMYIRKFLFLTVSQDSFLTRNANHQCSISKCAEENRPYEVVIVLRLRSGGALYYAAILRKREYSKTRIRKKWWFHDVWWMAYSLPQLSISIIVLLNFSWSCHTLKCRKLVVKDALKLLWHFHSPSSIHLPCFTIFDLFLSAKVYITNTNLQAMWFPQCFCRVL